MKALQARHRGQDLADAEADGRPVQRRDLDPARQRGRGGAFELLGRRPRRPRPAGRAARPVREAQGACCRRASRPSTGSAPRSRTAPSWAGAARSARSRPTPSSAAGSRAATRSATRCRRAIASFKMTQAILGVKAAYEKAQKAGADSPNQEQIIAAFEDLTFEGPGGTVKMALGKGHQAVMDDGDRHHQERGRPAQDRRRRALSGREGDPPEGIKSEAWIKSGFKAKSNLDWRRLGAPPPRSRCKHDILLPGPLRRRRLRLVAVPDGRGADADLWRDAHPQHRARQPLRARRLRGGVARRRLARRPDCRPSAATRCCSSPHSSSAPSWAR